MRKRVLFSIGSRFNLGANSVFLGHGFQEMNLLFVFFVIDVGRLQDKRNVPETRAIYDSLKSIFRATDMAFSDRSMAIPMTSQFSY